MNGLVTECVRSIIPPLGGCHKMKKKRRQAASAEHFIFAFPIHPSYLPVMPSFDIVSQVNPMEIENAVNQSRKELANRFDFKGSNAQILLEKIEIKLSAEYQFKIRVLSEIVMGKLSKRNISLKTVERFEPH